GSSGHDPHDVCARGDDLHAVHLGDWLDAVTGVVNLGAEDFPLPADAEVLVRSDLPADASGGPGAPQPPAPLTTDTAVWLRATPSRPRPPHPRAPPGGPATRTHPPQHPPHTTPAT